jgi:hypothetical protein
VTRRSWLALKWTVAAVTLGFVGRELWRRWSELDALTASLHPHWGLVFASGGVVLASYLVLIWTWQRTVAAWGARLRFRDAARVWFVSNLGRYIPGKVWQIGAMGALAQQAGTPAIAAVGSAFVVSLVNVLAGFAVIGATGAGTLSLRPWGTALLAALAVGLLAAPWMLPAATGWINRRLRTTSAETRLPHSAVWIAAAGCALAWLLYGLAFRLLHVAVLGRVTGDLAGSTSAFTASYLAGFLFLLAPGGLGVREVTLLGLLDRFGIASGAEALLLVVVSRVWLTILEIIPGVLYLVAPDTGRPPPPTATLHDPSAAPGHPDNR